MAILARIGTIAATALILLSGCGSEQGGDDKTDASKASGGMTGIYTDGNIQYEFTPERVYVTAPLAGTSATDYEVDGSRVLVGVAGSQQVLKVLDDGSLEGPMGIVLRKQRDAINPSGAGNASASKNDNSPSASAEAYILAMSKFDLEAAMAHVKNGERALEMPPEQLAAMKKDMQAQFESQGGVDSIRVLNEEVRGSEALVQVETKFGNGTSETESLRFVNEGGRWLLD